MQFLHIFARIANNCLDALNDADRMKIYRRDLIEQHPVLVGMINKMLAKFEGIDIEKVKIQVIFPIFYLIDLPSDEDLLEVAELIPAEGDNEMTIAYSDYQMGGHPNMNMLIGSLGSCFKNADSPFDFLRSFFGILYVIYQCKKKNK